LRAYVVPGRADASISRNRSSPIARTDIRGPVGRAVVGQQDVERRDGLLPEHRLELRAHDVRLVARGDDDR
jgi:hypothetical protein